MPEPLVQPFRGLRPVADKAQSVAAPPYDVMSSAEAREMAGGNPLSFLHISKPEIDLPEGTDVYSDAVYAKGAENMARMVAEGVVVRDEKPGYYIYRVAMDGHVQTGIAAAGSVEGYETNLIRRHETTRPDKETDRVKQIEAVNAQTGPVFTTHADNMELSDVVASVTATPPAYAVTNVGRADHSLWAVSEDDLIGRITAAFQDIGVIYIADGHHRSAAASRVAAARRAERGAGPWDRFLIVSFPESEVRIIDYNRVIRGLNGRDAEAFLAALGEAFLVEKRDAAAKPEVRRTFGMYLAGNWYSLAPKDDVPADAPAEDRLDVSLINTRVIEPILGIADQRSDPRIDFIGGARGMAELERRVDSGDWDVAFAYYPISVAELMAVADAQADMPPKITWFEPKLADGMVSLVLD